MVDISSQNNKINVTVSSSGNTANTNVTSDSTMYYSNKSKEWAISNRIVDNTDYSSKYYANESKKQADISTAKATEVVESGNTAVSNINSARDNAIIDVNTAGATQVANVNSAGTTQVNLAKEQVTLATNQANVAKEQATIATNKTSEVVASGNTALSNIDTAKNNAITSITNQETTSKNVLIDEGATQVGLIQNEGATQVANVQSTGFYMRDDKLYYINSQGEETEFKSGGSSRNVGEIITSSLPLTDAGLHLLDGTLINGSGIYQGFVDYIAELYNNTKVYNPSAFTVVGSPTITDDGIASGFSGRNYLSGSFTSITPSKIIFRIKAVYSSTPNAANSAQTIGKIKGTNSSPSIEYLPDEKKLTTARFHNNSNSDNRSAQITIPLNDGDVVEAEAIATSTSVTLNAKINGVPYTNTWSGNGLYCGAINGYLISNNNNWYWTGSIDLKQFSITVDGKEVFSGSKPANYFTNETIWQQSVTDYGVCGKFVYDSVNNTVRLPKVTGIIEGTTDVTALGDLVKAGLPNITGTINGPSGISSSGAFTVEPMSALTGGKSTSVREGNTYFNASRSNSIYGKSNTVQPQAIKVLYYIVIATTAKTDIQVDIDEIATDLNGKADTDLSNVTDTGYIKMAGAGMPSDKYIALTLGASGATYTAPANGWVNIIKRSSAANQYLNMCNMKHNFTFCGTTTAYNNGVECWSILPVSKGDIFRIDYTTGGQTLQFNFIYAVGSESEAS